MDLKKNLMLCCVAVIVLAFFLPWVSVESEAIGGISKLLTGKEQAAISSISGVQVPILANGQESRFMISIIKIFEPSITHADKKSFLICLVPLLSVLLFWLSNHFKDNQWVKLAIGIIGIAVFCGAVFKITTTDLDKMVLKVTIGIGLWLTFIGYLGIGLVSLAEFFKIKKS